MQSDYYTYEYCFDQLGPEQIEIVSITFKCEIHCVGIYSKLTSQQLVCLLTCFARLFVWLFLQPSILSTLILWRYFRFHSSITIFIFPFEQKWTSKCSKSSYFAGSLFKQFGDGSSIISNAHASPMHNRISLIK